MSRTFFCRSVNFTAGHHYSKPGADAAENKKLFGDAVTPHDHHWQLTVWLEGGLDENGMMVDLGQVDEVLRQEVTGRFHNQHINAVDAFFQQHQPTNEVLANYFAERLAKRFAPVKLAKLRIAEAPDLFAEWLP